MIVLTCLLFIATVAVHLAAGAATKQRPPAALMASAQLGVTSAIAAIGLAEHVITSTAAAAILTAAMATILICGFGGARFTAADPGAHLSPPR